MVGRRAKLGEIWDSGTVTYETFICTFDLVVFNVILGSFGALSQNGMSSHRAKLTRI